jgi:hypothetical protein
VDLVLHEISPDFTKVGAPLAVPRIPDWITSHGSMLLRGNASFTA